MVYGDTNSTLVRCNSSKSYVKLAHIEAQLKAEGIGLYRTEFPFSDKITLSNRGRAVHMVYKRLLDSMPEIGK